MLFDSVLLPSRRAASVAAGLWLDRTINDMLDANAASHPDRLALTAYRTDGADGNGDVRRFTCRELARLADRIAIGLWRLGVRRGDVVAMQLPNGWRFTLLYLACARIGAVINPLMPILRERELSFMLAHGEARVFIVPNTFRGFDYAAMARALQPQLPALTRVVVADGGGADDFDTLLTALPPDPEPERERDVDAAAILTGQRPGPDDITQLIYTSGTTGEPKGVMHSANTLFANLVHYAARMRLGGGDVILMASPMAHQTGFMYGLMMPVLLGAQAVLLDVWNPARAAAIIRDEGVTFTMASTPFLTDLTREARDSGRGVPTLKAFLCAGAPIPGPLVEQARATLGSKIVSAWGMSEIGVVTITELDDDTRAISTDGHPLPGVEVKVTGVAGEELPPGEQGLLLVRAASNFGGYLKRPQWNATDAQGWFDTGDLAIMDDAGYIRISGRGKDVIIRGGENIPVFEIESLLYRHPAVAQVAIVAYPDERLGERACACVVCKAGQTLDLPELVRFLKAQKVALQYIPERLELLDALPATPSGKVQKFRLREQLQQMVD